MNDSCANIDPNPNRSWGKKAQEECCKYGTGRVACDASQKTGNKFVRVPPVNDWNISKGAREAEVQ